MRTAGHRRQSGGGHEMVRLCRLAGLAAPAAYRLGSIYENTSGISRRPQALPVGGRAGKPAVHAQSRRDVFRRDRRQAGLAECSELVPQGRRPRLRDSQFNLGVIYSRGLSGAVDRAEAWKWFSLAAAQGDTESARKREDVAAKASRVWWTARAPPSPPSCPARWWKAPIRPPCARMGGGRPGRRHAAQVRLPLEASAGAPRRRGQFGA